MLNGLPYIPLSMLVGGDRLQEEYTSDLVGLGGNVTTETLMWGYMHGAFPMGLGEGGEPPWGWWSPDPRGVLHPSEIRVTRSLRKSARAFEVAVDRAFAQVVEACGDEQRGGRWITPHYQSLYLALHERGVAHSVEAWRGDHLAGGLICIDAGHVIAGESMFYQHRDASKVSLWALCKLLLHREELTGSVPLIDVQWATEHLCSLGASTMSKVNYLRHLHAMRPPVHPFTWSTRVLQDAWEKREAGSIQEK